MKDKLGICHLYRATINSLCGIKDAFLSGCAFRQEILFGLVQVGVLMAINERIWLKMLLVALWIVLMAFELVNSAIESVVDMVSPEWNLYAKHAKDFGSAAVFLIVLAIVGLWLFVIICKVC